MRRWWLVLPGVAVLAVAGLYLMPGPAPRSSGVIGGAAASASGCFFHFDMRLLRAEIPDKVGDCLETERLNPESGDSIQRTTGGLIVRRANDRLTAFTDGTQTWMRGPGGLAVRGNDERFEWEAPPPKPTAAAPPASGAGAPAAAGPTATAAPGRAAPSTPVPSTPTAAPSGPRATATPDNLVNEIAETFLVESLKRSGLPLSDVQALNAASDPEKLLGKPGQYSSKIVFKDKRLAAGDISIELFPSEAALKARQEKLTAAGQPIQVNPGARTIMRLPKEMTPEQARSYQQWMAGLRAGGARSP